MSQIASEQKGYRWLLAKGNNSELVKRVMLTRPSWVLMQPDKTSLFDFKWSPHSAHIKFDLLNKHGQKSAANHLEFHGCLTQKDQLFTNLKKMCELNHKDVLDYQPLTFVIDLTSRF